MSWRFDREQARQSTRLYDKKDTASFTKILIEPSFLVLKALVESLDISDEDKSSDAVAETLLQFLAFHDRLVPFLKMLISREVAQADQANTLFRRNSIASKMLSRYTKDHGARYLEAVLGPTLRDIQGLQLEQVELDPKRGASEQGSRTLKKLCQKVLTQAIAAQSECPLEFRHLCHRLKVDVTTRFGEKMGRSAVGGYIFLRFICPAMVAPENFGLDVPVSKEGRKILMKVSKVIQTLANGVTQFKEPHMQSLNGFLTSNVGAFSDFLDELATVPEKALKTASLSRSARREYASAKKMDHKAMEALLAIHHHLKRHIHKIGSIVAALETDDGVEALKRGAEKSGWLIKQGGSVKSWKRRWFVLKGSQLYYFKEPNAGVATERIPLDGTTVKGVGDKQFQISTQYRVYEIMAETSGDARDWVRVLRRAIDKVNSAKVPESPKGTSEGGGGGGAAEDAASPRSETAEADATLEKDVRGWLKKAGPKGTGWKKRWFILNNNVFFYFKGPNDSQPLGNIALDQARVRDVGRACRFNIETSERVYHLQADSVRDKDRWIQTLNQAKVAYIKKLATRPESGQRVLNSPGRGQLLGSGRQRTGSTVVSIESRAIDKEGYLQKQGGQIKTWKQRWFVLRGANLYYYKGSSDQEPIGSIVIADSKVTATTDVTLEILTHDRNFFLRASSAADCDAWVETLSAVAEGRASDAASDTSQEEAEAPVYRTAGQPVICKGFLQKQGGGRKNWRMRWFVLKGHILSYYKSPNDVQPAGVIPMINCSVALAEEKLGKKFAFEVSTRYRNYFMIAKDEYEMAKWMRHIEQMKEKKQDARSSSKNMQIFFQLNDILAEWER